MSNSINASYTDPILNSIRARTKTKDDGIPFLLLPVRLETRFMEVEQPLLTEDAGLFEKLLGQFGQINMALLDDVTRLNSNALRIKYNGIVEQLKLLNRDLNGVDKLAAQEITWLKQQESITQEKGQSAIRLLVTPAARLLGAALRRQLSVLRSRLNGLGKAKDPTYFPAKEFIDKLKYFERKWDAMEKAKVPYSNAKNKRRLYIYLTKSLDEITQYYGLGLKAIEDIKTIRKNQVDQIEALMSGLLANILSAPGRLNSIYPDDNWKAFINDFKNKIDDQLLPSGQGFAKKIMTRLRFLEKFKTVTAQDIYYKAIQTLVDLKKFNESKPRGYRDIKKSRKKLDKRVRTLANMTNLVITGTPGQIKNIQSLWQQMESVIEQYQQKVTTIQNLNDSQAFGVNTTINFTREKARNAIAGLKKQAPEKFTFHNNQQIMESGEFYLKAKEEIKLLQGAAEALQQGNPTPSKKAKLNNMLKVVSAKFKVASRKNIVLPQAEFQELQRAIQSAKEAIANVSDDATPANTATIRAVEEVGNNFLSIRGGGTNPLDNLELPPVLAVPTKTVNELWLRIFPDDIHVHTHEEKLTENELRLGKLFWTSYWAASEDKELEMAAWRNLRLALGVRRAAWVARKLQPREHSYRNKRPFFRNTPSRGIIDVVSQLKGIQELLKPIDSKDNYTQIIAKIPEAALLSSLIVTLNAVTAIETEQLYFLQRTSTPLQRIEGKLYLIQTEIDKLSTVSITANQASLTVIGNIFETYTQIRTHISGIKALSSKDFIEHTGISLTFPNVATKEEDWTEAPHSRTLPDRFVAITMQRNSYKHIVVGEPIPEKLQLGLDPEKFDLDDVFQLDDEGNLKVDEGMRWMTDYSEAIKVGMGISIPLTKEQAAEGFDKVLVLGIKDMTPNKARTTLETLLENHRFSADGMSVLKTGTSTNNTEDAKAGFNSSDNNDEESFRIEMSQRLFDANEQGLLTKDGQRLANALGIANKAFFNIENADIGQISNAQAINTALWNATMGYNMGEILDTIFTYDNIDRTRDFFTENVIARGGLPALRIGTQPYGILVSTAFSRLRHTPTGDKDILPVLTKASFANPAAIENELQLRYDMRLRNFLNLTNFSWSLIRGANVKHLDNVKDQNPQQHFMNMLGLNATTIEYFFRYGINIAMRGPDNTDMDFNVNFKEEEAYSPQQLRMVFDSFVKEGYFYNSFDFTDEQNPVSGTVAQNALQASRIRDQFEKARLFKARYLDKHVKLDGERIDAGILSETQGLTAIQENGDTYIDWLLQRNLYDILASNQISRLPSTSLLFLFLRQSLLGAYNYAALKVMQRDGLIEESYSKKIGSSEKYRVFHKEEERFTYSSSWTFLFKDLNRLEGLDYLELVGTPLFTHLNSSGREKSMADYLRLGTTGNANSLFTSFPNSNTHRPYLNKVKEVWNAIKHLNSLPTAELNRLLSEHLDLCTYRLDAWILGQSNKRLKEQRGKNPKGLHMGAYGWVENLRPGGAREEAIDLPAPLSKKGEPVFTDEDNEGFIHAPSINQAIAAAVLRSGYKANSQEEDLENTMAVNLSSARVRMALNLLDGVRNGLEVGAVLGFQFERGLHERYLIAELDKYIQPFRKKFPLTVPVEETAEGVENARETNVVNGMSLLDKINETLDGLDFENDKTLFEVLTENNFAQCPPWLRQFVISENSGNLTDLKVIIAEIDRMANAFDALGDLAISESVYQIVQGNHVRAAAMVNAFAEGKNPPVPQVIDTPRSGTVVTQRVVMNLKPFASNQNAKPVGWTAAMTPRALAEPSLNNWLGGIFGPAENIRCQVDYPDGADTKTVEVTVEHLKLQPIDFLYLISSAGHEGSGEINSRVAYHVRKEENLGVDIQLSLKFKDRAASWNNAVKSFYEIQPLLKQIKNMLTDVLPASASEMALPPDQPNLDNPGGFDLNELASRVNSALQSMEQSTAAAENLISTLTTDTEIEEISFTNAQLNELTNLLLGAAQHGIANAIPDAVIELNDEIGRDQLRQLMVVTKNLRKRLAKSQKQKEGISPDLPVSRQVEIYRDIAKSVFDKQFVLLPQYTLTNFSEVKSQLQLTDSDKGLLRSAETDFPMEEWLQGIGEVREKMYATEMAGMFADTFGQSLSNMVPVQLPFTAQADFVDNDHWLGMEYPDTYEPEEDKLSLVLMNKDQLLKGGAGALKIGFIVDEWVEIIPNKSTTTGLAFNYDQPDATAPQSLLLAVTPQETGKWEWDDLVYTMLETLNLAKNRAVEPDHLENTIFSQVLPAVMAEVVPPQLRENMGTADNRNPLGAQVVLDFADNLVKEE